MKSFFRIFLLALCGAALIVACQQPGTTALSKGSLTITIGNKIAARTIAPSSASTTVTSYSITGTGPDSDTLPGQPIVVTAPTGSGSTTISSLPTGTWQINVTAYNANGDIIGTASQSVQVTIGQNSMTIPVGPVAGTGTLSVTVNLTGVTLASPSIHATLTPLSGQTTNTSLTAFSLSGSTLTSASTLENGYYILTTTLFDGTSQQAPPETELVWIVTSETSSQTYTYSAASPGYGTLNLTLTPLATSLSVTLAQSGNVLTITITNPPTGLQYEWYLDGVMSSDTSANYNYSALAGTGAHSITGIAYTAGWAQAGSASLIRNF